MTTPFQMTVSPDFAPKNMGAWFIFNTWLQRQLDIPIHLELYNDFESQRAAIAQGALDIIYANPFDASMLVRDLHFVPVARPDRGSDECIVVVAQDAPYQSVEDLQPGLRVACTDDPDVELVGMILLEPADLDRTNVERIEVDTYPLVAAQLMRGRADVGFILEAAFEELSALTRRQLRPLVRSQISDIHHALLLGPRLRERHADLCRLLLKMPTEPRSQLILDELGVPGWALMEREDTEFMIDLMDTLKA